MPLAHAETPGVPRTAPRAHWPLLLALSAFAVSVAGILASVLAFTDGHLVYALDDSYTHMALARHLVKDGTWGLFAGSYCNCVSSILWPLVLAGAFAVTGVHEATPFVLNVFCAIAAMWIAAAALRRHHVAPGVCLLTLLAVVFVTPLTVAPILGMETALQCASALWLTASVVRLDSHRWQPRVACALLAALAVSVRYEGVFLVAAAILLSAGRRRWQDAVAIGAGGALPVAVGGAIAVAHGWDLLPSSVLLKSGFFVPGAHPWRVLHALGYTSVRALTEQADLLVVIVVLLWLFNEEWSRAGSWSEPGRWLAMAAMTVLLHLQFGATSGSLGRYEAYLVAVASVAAGIAIGSRGGEVLRHVPAWPARVAAVVLLIVLAAPVVQRGVRAAESATGLAVEDFYGDYYVVAQFLGRHYRGDVVGRDAVGAVSFFADVQVVDALGLATPEVARSIRAGTMGFETLDAVLRAHHATVVVLDPTWPDGNPWFQGAGGSVPASWQRVARWSHRGAPQAMESFYALSGEDAARLQRSLVEFEAELPGSVVQTFDR